MILALFVKIPYKISYRKTEPKTRAPLNFLILSLDRSGVTNFLQLSMDGSLLVTRQYE